MYRIVLIIAIVCVVFAGCNPSPYFQREETLPQNAWSYDGKLSFKFDITDTGVIYIPYFLVRHTEAYPFRNIWVWMYTKLPGETAFHKTRLNIPMADASGRWYGRQMGEVIEQRLIIPENDSARLDKKGSYEIRFEQNMRVNPLPEVLNVGLRVEKTPMKRKAIAAK